MPATSVASVRALFPIVLGVGGLLFVPCLAFAQDGAPSEQPSLSWQLCSAVNGNDRSPEKVQRLLASGAQVNDPCDDHTNDRPLHRAIYVEGRDRTSSQAQAITDVLLAHGADINLRDRNGHTPLELALDMDAARVVRILRARDAQGEDPNHVIFGVPVALGLGFSTQGEPGFDLTARPSIAVAKKHARAGLLAYGEVGTHAGNDKILGAGLGLHLGVDYSQSFYWPTVGGYAHKSDAGDWSSGVTAGVRRAWLFFGVRLDARVTLHGEAEHAVVVAVDVDPVGIVIGAVKILSTPTRW